MKKAVMALFVSLTFSAAFALTGAEVVDMYFNQNPAPDYSRTEFKVESYRNDNLDDQMTLVQTGHNKDSSVETTFEVTKSPGMKDTRLLQSKKNGVDDRYIYLPSLRTVRRLAVQSGSKSFVGTEFSYNDTGLRQTAEDTHELVSENETITVAGTQYTCYVVKSSPVNLKDLEYNYRVQYFDKKTMIPVKIDYFDKFGKTVKVMEVKKLASMTGATGKTYNIRQVCEVQNMKSKRRSVLTIQKMELDKSVSASYFTQNWLSTGKVSK